MSFDFPTSPPEPMPRKSPSTIQRTKPYLQLWYYRYEVTFSTYMLTGNEKIILNSIVLFFFGLIIAGFVSYVLPLLARVALRVLWLYTGRRNTKIVMSSNTTGWNEMAIGIAY